MRLAALALVAVLIVAAADVKASPIPTYPVEQLCATLRGDTPSIKAAFVTRCIEQQQREYDALKYGGFTNEGEPYSWDDLPDDVASQCTASVEASLKGGYFKLIYPFTALRACVGVGLTRYRMAHPGPIPKFQR